MKRIIVLFMTVVCFLFCLSACGNKNGSGEGTVGDNTLEIPVTGESKVLVAYFSWSGNTQQIARWIAEKTGGDIFRIVPEVPYATDFNGCADRAQTELNNGTRPPLSEHIDKDIMAEYDVVFVGFPIWWYDLPMPVWTFLEEYDFAGKTVIPFFIHNGSSSGASSVSTVNKLCPNSNVLTDKYYSHSGNSVSGAEGTVDSWLAGLGISFEK